MKKKDFEHALALYKAAPELLKENVRRQIEGYLRERTRRRICFLLAKQKREAEEKAEQRFMRIAREVVPKLAGRTVKGTRIFTQYSEGVLYINCVDDSAHMDIRTSIDLTDGSVSTWGFNAYGRPINFTSKEAEEYWELMVNVIRKNLEVYLK